jgi:hypothetical protein
MNLKLESLLIKLYFIIIQRRKLQWKIVMGNSGYNDENLS